MREKALEVETKVDRALEKCFMVKARNVARATARAKVAKPVKAAVVAAVAAAPRGPRVVACARMRSPDGLPSGLLRPPGRTSSVPGVFVRYVADSLDDRRRRRPLRSSPTSSILAYIARRGAARARHRRASSGGSAACTRSGTAASGWR